MPPRPADAHHTLDAAVLTAPFPALVSVLATSVGEFGYWYAFGDADGFVLIKAPDDVMAAGLLVEVASTGAFTNVSTTKLLTVEEALDALGRGGGVEYRAPGAPGSCHRVRQAGFGVGQGPDPPMAAIANATDPRESR